MFQTHRTHNGYDVYQSVNQIVTDNQSQQLLKSYGLNAKRITWEDTGRTKSSCWGPNISDMTLCLKNRNVLAPVIRKPNFADVTEDIPVTEFFVVVGNEHSNSNPNGDLKNIPLKEYLQNISKYTDENVKSMWNDRDEVILTSCQTCVLPDNDKTKFAIQLFNYQSRKDNPAVLVILSSRYGTSAQIVEKRNQKLFFNNDGINRWFQVERLKRNDNSNTNSFKTMTTDEKASNVIAMYQIPLKQKVDFFQQDGRVEQCARVIRPPVVYRSASVQPSRGMNLGQLSLGDEEGKFIGTKGLELERDPDFPIRCTFQYYRVTDTGRLTESEVIEIAKQMKNSEKKALHSGSLVFSNPKSSERVTEPKLPIFPAKKSSSTLSSFN